MVSWNFKFLSHVTTTYPKTLTLNRWKVGMLIRRFHYFRASIIRATAVRRHLNFSHAPLPKLFSPCHAPSPKLFSRAVAKTFFTRRGPWEILCSKSVHIGSVFGDHIPRPLSDMSFLALLFNKQRAKFVGGEERQAL